MKRLFDIGACLLLGTVFLPFLLIAALAVYLDLGPPLLFRQQRPGFMGKPFEIIKFRTMQASAEEAGGLREDKDRITTVGRLLRSTSLDELPQLWTILKGDMSLVGPRPLLMEYLPLYNERQFRRHEVRPGLTGWAQVNGRNTLTWEEKFELDVWYVDNRSFYLDLKILILTLFKIIKREGISARGHVTMDKFTGNRG